MLQIEKKINPKSKRKQIFLHVSHISSVEHCQILANLSTNQLFLYSGKEMVRVQPGPLLLAAVTVPPMS